jgi:hypothetical protein
MAPAGATNTEEDLDRTPDVTRESTQCRSLRAPSVISLSPQYAYTDGALTTCPRHGLGRPVTDPQHRALATAAGQGRVLRGGKDGQAPVRVPGVRSRG